MDATLISSSYSHWFYSEVVRWRTGAAIVWSMIFLFPITFIFSVVSSVSLSKPLSSVIDCLFRVAALEFWLVTALLLFMVLLSAWLNARHYRVSSFITKTRLSRILSYIHPSRVLFVIGHFVTTGAATWCAARLVGGRYRFLSYPCPHDLKKHCLNEVHLFNVLYGCINGAFLAVSFFTTGKYVMRFPAVSQRKLFEVKGQFGELLMNAACHAFKYLKYFCLIYYFSGSLVKTSAMINFDLDIERNITSVDTLRGMMDVSMLVHSWLIVTFAIVVVSLPHLLHCSYNMQPYLFPVEPPFDEIRDLSLHKAIECQNYPILQYLACLDLSRLSMYSTSRRKQLFDLATLSSQPVNWNNLRSACLAELDAFIRSLGAYCGVSNGYAQGFVIKPPVSGFTNRPTNNIPVTRLQDEASTAGAEVCQMRKGLIHSVGAFICRRPLVAYFICENPEMVSRSLFADAQKYIFIVDGLSRVVCASFTEDVYGVVQPSLSIIVSTLLDMLDAVDRHLKLYPIMMRRTRIAGCSSPSGDQVDIALRFALKTSIRCAIYRLVVTFQSHLNSIELSSEHKKRLQMFEDFKE